jgi:hypothetical protein
MPVFIHRAPELQKCLEKLLRADGRAALAAKRVEEIISTLATDACRKPEEVNKHTRHGEARIEKCKKFDLVGGYRLVYIKKEQHYFFLFTGTHDDCDHWLNNHKRLKPTINRECTTGIERATEAGTPLAEQRVVECDWDYEEILMQQIDEKILRRVFRGLCGE